VVAKPEQDEFSAALDAALKPLIGLTITTGILARVEMRMYKVLNQQSLQGTITYAIVVAPAFRFQFSRSHVRLRLTAEGERLAQAGMLAEPIRRLCD
jgi:hypothetical protein